VNKKTAAGLDGKPIKQRHKTIGEITSSGRNSRLTRSVTINNEMLICPTITQLRLEQKSASVA